MIRVPRLRSRARELLTDCVLADKSHQVMAQVIADAGESVAPATLIGTIEERVAGSAETISGADLVSESEVDPEVLADDLVRRLKEFELERRIAVGRARLRQADSFKSTTDYDDVFREVSSLQKQLDALRRAGGEAG